MFGYIVANRETLSKARQARLKAIYCGLCSVLKTRHGLIGSATLSFDLTFLAMLQNALYEPGEHPGKERCIAHPAQKHDYVVSPVMEYIADMNLALAYHKCRDDWTDDCNPVSASESILLCRAYHSVEKIYPAQCEAIESWLREIHTLESKKIMQIDLPVNATGRLLGFLFIHPEEKAWADELRTIGDGLGRFVYFMDAYEDLPGDLKKHRYNPLEPLKDREDYEALCQSAMTMMIADATEAFERLPIVLDADILRNVLYSGVWSKFAYLQSRRNSSRKGAR